jgi:hypothetical protein
MVQDAAAPAIATKLQPKRMTRRPNSGAGIIEGV